MIAPLTSFLKSGPIKGIVLALGTQGAPSSHFIVPFITKVVPKSIRTILKRFCTMGDYTMPRDCCFFQIEDEHSNFFVNVYIIIVYNGLSVLARQILYKRLFDYNCMLYLLHLRCSTELVPQLPTFHSSLRGCTTRNPL